MPMTGEELVHLVHEELASAWSGGDVALLLEAPPMQRRANLLFAAVHDLLLAGVAHPLARYYSIEKIPAKAHGREVEGRAPTSQRSERAQAARAAGMSVAQTKDAIRVARIHLPLAHVE